MGKVQLVSTDTSEIGDISTTQLALPPADISVLDHGLLEHPSMEQEETADNIKELENEVRDMVSDMT